jgi:hypothetical protein
MHKLLLACLILSPLVSNLCFAQHNAIEIICEDCRDPERYPDDFVNFAFNQIYGPEAWLSWDQADDLFISNLDLDRVYVDADLVFYGFGFKGLELPLWPANLLQFTLALPSGRLVTALRSIFLTPLPVPATEIDVTDNTDTSAPVESVDGDSDDGEEEDEDGHDTSFDEDLEDWDELEADEYFGHVEIEDPDEYGNFEDPEWCEEC